MRSRGGKDRFDISIILNLTFVSLTQSAVFHMESSHLKVILSTTGEDHGEDLTSLCPSIKESKLTRGTLQHDTNGAYLLVSTTWRCRERGREGSTHEEGAKEMEKRKVSEQRGMTRTSPVLWTLILAWPLLAALDFPRLLLSHPRILLVPFARFAHCFIFWPWAITSRMDKQAFPATEAKRSGRKLLRQLVNLALLLLAFIVRFVWRFHSSSQWNDLFRPEECRTCRVSHEQGVGFVSS